MNARRTLLRYAGIRVISARTTEALKRLVCSQTGVSVVEFALVLPVFLGFGAMGVELANMASANMEVSQIALSVADNASRLGQTDNTAVAPTIGESDVDAVMFGALKQGAALNFAQNGRIILSSLEKDPSTGKQYIHWQRCAGNLDKQSAYGNDSDNNGLDGDASFPTGLGQPGHQVMADDGKAVMFVEVYYNYQPLFSTDFFGSTQFRREAAFVVRDDRDLHQNDGGDGLTGTAHSTC